MRIRPRSFCICVFAEYTPEGMDPMLYTLVILPEMIATVILVSIPVVMKALNQVKEMALVA